VSIVTHGKNWSAPKHVAQANVESLGVHGRVPVAPGHDDEMNRRGARLDECLADRLIADLRRLQGSPSRARLPCELVCIRLEILLCAARAAEEIGAGHDDERARGLGRARAMEAGDPPVLAPEASRIRADLARRVERRLPAFEERRERARQIAVGEHEVAEPLHGDRRFSSAGRHATEHGSGEEQQHQSAHDAAP